MMLWQRILAQTTDAQTTRELFTHWTWTPWATVLFALAAAAGITYLYTRESSPAGKAYRALLIALRLVAIALVLLMLSELMLTTSRTGLPRLTILIDRSASMELPATDQLDSDEASTRLRAARELLLEEDTLIDRLRQDYQLDVRLVGDGAVPIESLDDEQLRAELDGLDPHDPAARASRLGDAIAVAIESRDAMLPAAVVLLSDGRNTSGRSLDEARELARRRGVPIYAIGYGSTNQPPDLRIANLIAEDTAFMDDLLALSATLEAVGAEGKTVQVRVRDRLKDEVISEQPVKIDSPRFSQVVQLVVRPDRQGEISYSVEVVSLPDERDTDNNIKIHQVLVRDQQVRVLLAAGYPNYEYRYLKNLLDRDSSFALTSYLQEADVDYATQDQSAIDRLPVDEKGLDDFDVLVLMDLNPRLLPPQWWQSVERHVVERGGGLVLVSGPRYFPWMYDNQSAVATLSPVITSEAGRTGGLVDQGFRLQLTPLAELAVAMQLGPSPAESRAIWQELSTLYWYVAANQTKPAARVQAVHPTARTSSGLSVPLIAEQYVGAGRVLYHGIDSTWRWRFRVGDVFFARYWGQSLRQLARGKALDNQRKLELQVDRPRYELGQPVRIRLKLDSKQLASLDGSLQLILSAEGQPNRQASLTPNTAMPEHWQATFSDLPPGKYRATVADSRLESPPEAVEFRVIAPPGELAEATMDQAGLQLLTEETYGKFYTPQGATGLADDLPEARRIPLKTLPPVDLWNKWWMLAAITGCLTTEWILRKRRAML